VSVAVAAIDCGTNSTRLLIAAGDGSTVDRRMIITRLGEGVDRTGRLAPAAIERSLAVLRQYRSAMDAAGVGAWMATATSAARDAANAGDFLEPAAAVLGGPIRVLAGEQEGRLSYRGATSSLDPADGPYLVVDVGGGSTELVSPAPSGSRSGAHAYPIDYQSPDASRPKAADIVAESLDVGCVRITERWLTTDPPTTAEMLAATAEIEDLLASAKARERFGHAKKMVGLAGTVSALAVLELGLGEYARDAVHHTTLRLADVRRLTTEMAARPLAQRRQMRGMEVGRADVLIGGSLVLSTIMETMGQAELVVSESDILDGVVAELLD
jgi:exopolyphosphatase/guanosine-5'-triphosphate,3'-diphosphate pyrophosphatase